MEKISQKTLVWFSAIAVFCILFNAVYSYLGHGVISHPMRLAFLYPLILGVGVYGFLFWKKIPVSILFYNLFNAAIATLTVGGLYQGVIDVAGADTDYGKIYIFLGIFLMVCAGFFQKFSQK